MKKDIYEKIVDETVMRPSLKRMVTQMMRSAGFTGGVDFVGFPNNLENDEGVVPSRKMPNTTVQKVLRALATEYKFVFFTVNGGLTIMHRPKLSKVGSTDLATRPAIELRTEAMRSNPKMGIATANIYSNLDPSIAPSSVVDLSKLLTVPVDATAAQLELVDGYLQNFSRYSIYQAFAVQHKGSNYTGEWSTVANCLSPTEGTLMPSVAWAQF